MRLILDPNIPDPDGFYDELLAAHAGLSDAESAALNARLVLVLANHVGDRAVLREAFSAAQASGATPAVDPSA
ncbi:DUF2783 domain-containing protein [Jannaschia formosa]|uniref:DUF2783 domain-containing protein n=1 Tax=Jannaschia formosa TaxID=2259592 RepID=UPI000E1BE210|nr:DUF2783 domain-containing protein [Jannaschia formosa]TFL18503.1 DUF2783 domain-containing protein [Jannaschia formosa]